VRLLEGQVFHRGLPPGGAHDPQGRRLADVEELRNQLEKEPGRQVWFLFPSEDSTPLEREWIQERLANASPQRVNNSAVHLVVPDGTWKQASKMGRRELSSQRIIPVRLASPRPSRYRLRHSPHAQNISTFEAIAQAYGAIVGASDPTLGAEVDRMLTDFFDQAIGHILEIKGRGLTS
jgi:DTW domain-containing protein YfiP